MARLPYVLEYLRWISGSALLLFFALTLIGNLACVLVWFVRHRHASLVLIVGGVAGALGILLLPVQGIRIWCWVPLIADFAVPYGIAVIIAAVLSLIHRLRHPL